MNIIGFDFSIEKPACCIFNEHEYKFRSWPWGLREDLKKLYRIANVDIIDRQEEKYKGSNSSEKMRNSVERADFLANLIYNSFTEEELTKDTWIVWEGLSFASSGNVILQLGGYKYMIMNRFREKISLEKQITYAPITIRKTANCSKKGMGKKEMIKSFINTNLDNNLRNNLALYSDSFKKRGGLNWIDHLDDFVDAFWLVETFRQKEVEPFYSF